LIIARPGTYGSSGNHYRRRQAEEFRALNAAVDAIKARYAIRVLSLADTAVAQPPHRRCSHLDAGILTAPY
jgi:hypothetical protein